MANIFNPYKKKYLHISSNDNILPYSNNNCEFKVNLPQLIKPVWMKLLFFQSYSTSFTYGFEPYFFPGGIMLFPLDESAAGGTALINIQIPIGIYNAKTFCTQLGTLMTAASTVGATYTVVPNLVTFKYTITSDMEFTIPWLDVQTAASNATIPSNYWYSGSGFSATNSKIARGPNTFPNYSVPVYNYAAALSGLNYVLETPYNYQFSTPSPLFINILEFNNNTISSSQGSFNFILPNDTVAGSTYLWKTDNSYEQVLNLVGKQINTMTIKITAADGNLFYQGADKVDMYFEYHEPDDLLDSYSKSVHY